MQASIGGPVIPENLGTIGIELRPDRPAVVQVEVDAGEVVELVGEDDRLGRGARPPAIVAR